MTASAVDLRILDLEEAWENAEAKVNLLASELRWYCIRYDAGDLPCIEARESFAHALQVVGQAGAPEPAPDRHARENRVGMISFAVGALLGSVGTVLVLGWVL